MHHHLRMRDQLGLEVSEEPTQFCNYCNKALVSKTQFSIQAIFISHPVWNVWYNLITFQYILWAYFCPRFWDHTRLSWALKTPVDCAWPLISFSQAFWQQYQGSFISDTHISGVILRYFRHSGFFFTITIPVFLFLLSLLRQYYLAGPAAQTVLIHTLLQKASGWGTELYHLHLREEALSS